MVNCFLSGTGFHEVVLSLVSGPNSGKFFIYFRYCVIANFVLAEIFRSQNVKTGCRTGADPEWVEKRNEISCHGAGLGGGSR